MDIGYVIAMINKEFPNAYECELYRLSYEVMRKKSEPAEEVRERNIREDADFIRCYKPHAVFISIENILWSKVFAFGRAVKIAEKLREYSPDAFIALQSFKMLPEEITAVLERDIFDCVISGSFEKYLRNFEEIISKKPVPGIYYPENQENGIPDEQSCSACANKELDESPDNLDDLPSPYLNHVFDNFIQMNQLRYNHSFRAFLVSSRGCSYGCYYCFRSVKHEKVRYFSAQRFYDEMEYLLNSFGVRRFFVLDDAFLYSKERLREFVKEFQKRSALNPGLEHINIFVMARPETIDEEVVEILSKLKISFIQIGLQTINPAIQHYMNRAVKPDYFMDINKWIKKYDIRMSLDIIVGLPNDSIDWLKKTLLYALSLKPNSLQIKQFYLNQSTLFHVNREKYGIETEQRQKGFETPYVIKANGIDEAYHKEANEFILKQVELHPDIIWKYLGHNGKFISPELFPRTD